MNGNPAGLPKRVVPEINWKLIERFKTEPHPNLNGPPDGPPDLPTYVGEALMNQRITHHLLDLAGIPRGTGAYDKSVEARVFLLVCRLLVKSEQLDRIASWHDRESGPGGTFGDFCVECGRAAPCDTRRMSDGTHEDLADFIPDPTG